MLTLSLELPLLLSESLVGDVGDLENLSEEAEGDLGGAESEGERGGPWGEEGEKTESSLGLLSITMLGGLTLRDQDCEEFWEEKDKSLVSEHLRELALSEETAETPSDR